MKKVIALILALGLLFSSALAAEWREGCSPAQPYTRLPAADLTKTIGYMMYYPKGDVDTKLFCDSLEIYLPREDVQVGSGRIRLFGQAGEVLNVSVQDERFVTQRPMTEDELEGLIWGGGVCFEVKLPVSLTLGESYYVNFDEGIIIAPEYGIPNSAVDGKDRWVINLNGDYGVSELSYSVIEEITGEDGEKKPGERVLEERVPADEANAVTFTVALGGDAKRAYLHVPDLSIEFESLWIEESGPVTGFITSEDIGEWGVIFMDENGEAIDIAMLGRAADEAP